LDQISNQSVSQGSADLPGPAFAYTSLSVQVQEPCPLHSLPLRFQLHNSHTISKSETIPKQNPNQKEKRKKERKPRCTETPAPSVVLLVMEARAAQAVELYFSPSFSTTPIIPRRITFSSSTY
jgi:hypothetical protein